MTVQTLSSSSSSFPDQVQGMFLPELHRRERYIVFSLFLLSFLYLCLFRHFTAMEPDEGILLQGAQRILAGQVPYRDFFSFYTPGSYYALALLFKIFGSSLPVARTALALAGAILSSIAYLLARRVCSRAVALTMATLATLTTLPYRFLVLHNWDSTLWACLALYCAVRLLEMPSRKWAFALGLFTSLTVLFEQSKGAGLCLGLGMGLLAIWFLQGRRSLLNRFEFLAFVIGFAGPIAITFAFRDQENCPCSCQNQVWPGARTGARESRCAGRLGLGTGLCRSHARHPPARLRGRFRSCYRRSSLGAGDS